MSILNDDINQMERFLNGGANDLIQIVTGSVLVGAVFFALAAKIALLALLPVPLIIYGAFWFQRRLAPRYARVREMRGRPERAPEQQPARHRHHQGLHRRGVRGRRTCARPPTAIAQANGAAIRSAAAITPIIRMAILAGFTRHPAVWRLPGAARTRSAWAATRCWSTSRSGCCGRMTRLADMTDLYQRSMASIQRVMDLVQTPIAIAYGGARAAALGGGRGAARVRRRALRLRHASTSRAADAARRLPSPTLQDISLHIPAGPVGGLRGQHRQRQEHPGQVAAALLRTAAGRASGWTGDRSAELRPARTCAAPSATSRRTASWPTPRSPRTSPTVFPKRARPPSRAAAVAAEAHEFIRRCRRATTRRWASAARSCRAASASGSRWRAPS